MPATSDPPSGSVIASEPIGSTGQGRTHPALDLPRVAGGHQVRQRDARREQGREHPAGPAGVVELLGQHERIERVAAPAADPGREGEPDQALPRGPGCSARGSSPARSHSSW